jgi:hypothetical protein
MWFGNDDADHVENGGIDESTRSTEPVVSHNLFVAEIRRRFKRHSPHNPKMRRGYSIIFVKN